MKPAPVAPSLLVFAHVPPPHHGQSYMVRLLLEELRSHPEAVRCFHVDCRVSDRLEEVGRSGPRKVLRLLKHCARALWLRWRHGPMLFYYVPAPGKRGAVYRDWLVMALCRPFFRRGMILHWHAGGLGEWTQTRALCPERVLTRWLLGGASLSLVLARAVAIEQAVFRPRRVCILPNGIPDPCPDFTTGGLAAARAARARERAGVFHRRDGSTGSALVFRVLFLAHCTREKGLFDALDAIGIANQRLAEAGTPLRCRLTVAGQFPRPEEREAFEAIAKPSEVEYAGFVAGAEKDRLYRECDCFLFPTFYANEVMPVTLIEALAYGMPIVSTQWRAIPEMLPEPGKGCWLVEPRRPEATAGALLAAAGAEQDVPNPLRRHFTENFRLEVFGRRFLEALRQLG